MNHPQKTIVKSLPSNGRKTRKYDGIFHPRTIGGYTVLGELVSPKSGGLFTTEDRELLARHGRFWAAFDVVADCTGSLCDLPTHVRDAVLQSLTPVLARSELKSVLAETIVDESPESVIARGGEGVCWQDWSSPYGSMLVVKCGEIHTCRVTDIGGTQSVGIVDSETGQDRGNIKLGGGKVDSVRSGSLIRVETMSVTDSGKFRQATPCREWLIQF